MSNYIKLLESIYCLLKKIYNKLENENIVLKDTFNNSIE